MFLLDADSFPRSVCPPDRSLVSEPRNAPAISLCKVPPHRKHNKSQSQLLHCFFFLMFWPYCAAYGILVPRPVIKLVPPASEVWSLNHWTAGKVPQLLTLTSNLIIGILDSVKVRWREVIRFRQCFEDGAGRICQCIRCGCERKRG